MNKRPILVTGAHRSGSTWVGQVLAQAQGTAYLHEPFNPIYASSKAAPINKWFLYIGSHNQSQYHASIKALLNWNYQPIKRLLNIKSIGQLKLWLKYTLMHGRSKGNRMILKDPIALFSTEWLVEKMGVEPLILVRHPAAFVYSLKRKSWAFPFDDLLSQPELIVTYFSEYKGQIEAFANEEKDIVEQACLLWNIMYSFVAKMQSQHLEWLIITHEQISEDPQEEFKKIFSKLDLFFDQKVTDFISQSSGQENAVGTVSSEENLKRDSKSNVSYWKEKLNKSQIEFIKQETSKVWPIFYSEDSW